MADLGSINKHSVRLILKSKQLQKLLAFDRAALDIADSLCECALFVNLNIGNAVGTDDENRAAKSYDRALQKVGLAKYYVALLQKTKYLSPNALNSFFADLDKIEEGLRHLITAE